MQKKFSLLACLIFCVGCFAQQYPFVHYTPKDGLINSRVRKAYQDSKGRMYFMTYGGLSVYDGARFKNYTTQNGLLSDLVNDVLEVGEDSLLVAVNTCGLNVLVRGEMKTLSLATNGCHVLNQLLKSHDGSIYASADDGLCKIGPASIKMLLASGSMDYLGAIAEFGDFIIFSTNDLKAFKGLYLYSKKTDLIVDVVPGIIVSNLKCDHNNIIWVTTGQKVRNLDTMALMSGKLELRLPYTPFIGDTAFIPGALSFNSQNEPFIMTGKDILHYSSDKQPVNIASPDPSQSVQVIFIDREDVLWICHDGNGVYKLSNTRLHATTAFSQYNRSGIRTTRSLERGSVWIIMKDGEWLYRTGTTVKSFHIKPAIDILPLQITRTELYGVYRSQLFVAPLPKNENSTLRFSRILSLPDSADLGLESVVDPYDNIIFFERSHICVLSNRKLIFTYPVRYTDLVQGMYIDKNRELWVVSRSGGLTLFSLHPETPSNYLRPSSQFRRELGNGSPRCMKVDQNEVLWIGTRFNGLLAFDYKAKQFRKLGQWRTQDGLTDNFVTSLATDDRDNVIIGTQTGLDRLIKLKDNDYRLENITKSNNLFSYIVYTWAEATTAFALTNTGMLYQVEGVAPAKDLLQPRLLIEELKIDGKTISSFQFPLALKYYQRNISFSVAAPTFIDETQVKYSYQLSGTGNNGWSDTTSIADINLLNLSPGKYTLRVKAFFPSTDYAPKESAFSFEILPPWWQTVLFRLIATSSVIGLLILSVRLYYRNKLRQQKVILEKQQAVERERTRIATDMHDDLGAGLSRIKFLSETIGIKKQQQLPIEEDISKIREYSHEMIDKMGEIVWALNEKNDSLSDLLSYTRSYAAEYLSQNGIACTVNLPDQLSSAFVSGEFRRNVFLAVKEILHNVVKHSQANHVLIDIRENHNLRIEVQDDGKGFDPSNIRAFSNGLHNIKKRMKGIGGNVDIEGVHGTSIKLTIPLAT